MRKLLWLAMLLIATNLLAPTSTTTTASAATDFCVLMVTGVGLGCTQESPPSTDSYCQVARPFRWHRADTTESKRQAKIINQTYKRLCPAEYQRELNSR